MMCVKKAIDRAHWVQLMSAWCRNVEKKGGWRGCEVVVGSGWGCSFEVSFIVNKVGIGLWGILRGGDNINKLYF